VDVQGASFSIACNVDVKGASLSIFSSADVYVCIPFHLRSFLKCRNAGLSGIRSFGYRNEK
jgi:hypothetical protein